MDTRWSQKEPSPECFAGLETLLTQMWNSSRQLILKDVGVHTGDKAWGGLKLIVGCFPGSHVDPVKSVGA